jgi:Zn-dependent peptidase ImmA (M78 family)
LAVTVPWYTYEELRAKADALLAEHHPSGTIPVPIGEIVEFKFDVSIIPIPGIKRLHNIDAYLTKDRKSIRIDESVLMAVSPHRFRFSLAHELNRILLHAEVYEGIAFSTVEEWKVALASLPAKERNNLEWHANNLAGLNLAPNRPLRACLDAAIETARAGGIDLVDRPDIAKSFVSQSIVAEFLVSSFVIERRMEADNLWPPRR